MRGRSLRPTLTVVTTVILLFSLSGYQVTSETASGRLLGRLAAAVIELDRWLPAHAEDLRLLAAEARGGSVRPAGLPVPIALPVDAVAASDAKGLRAMIVEATGAALRRDGLAAFRDDAGAGGSLGVQEPVRWTVALLGDSAHAFWGAALLLSVVALVGFAAALLLEGRPLLGPLALGGGLAAAAAFAAWLLALAADQAFASAIDSEIALILRNGAWIGLRNGLAVGGAGLALLLLLGSRRDREAANRPLPASTAPPEAPPN